MIPLFLARTAKQALPLFFQQISEEKQRYQGGQSSILMVYF
jgi:hypothetical protein